MHRILIVEDDSVIANAIANHIAAWGCETKIISDFQNVLVEFISYEPQLVLMDISLPFFNGYHWCTQIRNISKVPIIFISSASDNMNIVMAMNMGGDDFIAKPFDLNVLMAKVQAMLRRTYDFSGISHLLQHKDAVLNMNDATLTVRDKRIELTKNEFRILVTLIENKGKIVSREALMTKLWETDSFIDENTLTVNMARLRKKLDECGLKNFITTKKGLGYLVEL